VCTAWHCVHFAGLDRRCTALDESNRALNDRFERKVTELEKSLTGRIDARNAELEEAIRSKLELLQTARVAQAVADSACNQGASALLHSGSSCYHDPNQDSARRHSDAAQDDEHLPTGGRRRAALAPMITKSRLATNLTNLTNLHATATEEQHASAGLLATPPVPTLDGACTAASCGCLETLGAARAPHQQVTATVHGNVHRPCGHGGGDEATPTVTFTPTSEMGDERERATPRPPSSSAAPCSSQLSSRATPSTARSEFVAPVEGRSSSLDRSQPTAPAEGRSSLEREHSSHHHQRRRRTRDRHRAEESTVRVARDTHALSMFFTPDDIMEEVAVRLQGRVRGRSGSVRCEL
jgi:hypothetical protein